MWLYHFDQYFTQTLLKRGTIFRGIWQTNPIDHGPVETTGAKRDHRFMRSIPPGGPFPPKYPRVKTARQWHFSCFIIPLSFQLFYIIEICGPWSIWKHIFALWVEIFTPCWDNVARETDASSWGGEIALKCLECHANMCESLQLWGWLVQYKHHDKSII